MRCPLSTSVRLCCYVVTGVVVALCSSCARPRDHDQTVRREARRDVQDVYYEIVMALADAEKAASIEQVLRQLREDKGDALFHSQAVQSAIYVNSDTEMWRDPQRNPEAVAVYVQMRKSDGTARLVCKRFNNEFLELAGCEQLGVNRFWSCSCHRSEAK